MGPDALAPPVRHDPDPHLECLGVDESMAGVVVGKEAPPGRPDRASVLGDLNGEHDGTATYTPIQRGRRRVGRSSCTCRHA